MKHEIFFILVILLLSIGRSFGQDSVLHSLPIDRNITDVSGRSIEVAILEIDKDSLRIRRKSDQLEFVIPVERLSRKDRDWLAELRKNKDSKAATTKLNKQDPDPIPSLPKPEAEPKPELKPEAKTYPKPVSISNESILAEQIERGLVPPPAGRTALQTTIRFTDGRVIAGYVYDVKEGQFWYADADMIQKEAALSELEPLSHLALEHWIEQKPFRTSPTMTFILEGEEIHASILRADDKQVTFQKESGELLERVPVENLDEMGRNFIAEWLAETWRPDKWEWAVDAEFTAVKPFFSNGRALVKKEQKWGVIDLKGAYVEQPRFDHIQEIPNSMNMKVFEDGKCGLLNEVANLVLSPAWEDVGDLQHGLIPVKSQGKWGYAAEGGELVIPCVWDDAWRFSQVGTAVVTLDGKRGFIDRSGKVIVKPEWDGALPHTPEGIAAVRRGNGWALVNGDGKLLTEAVWNFRWEDRRFELGYIPAWPMTQLGKGESFSSWYRRGRTRSDGLTFLGIDGKPGATPKLREGVCLPTLANQNFRPWKNSETFSPQFPYPRMEDGEPKKGLIDLKGKVVFKPEYDEVVFINPDTYFLKKGSSGQISDVHGNVILEGKISSARVLQNGPGFDVNIDKKRVIYWNDWQPVLPAGREALTFVDSYGQDLIFSEGDKDSPKVWWRADFMTRKLHRFEGASRIYWVKSLADHDRVWLEDAVTKRWHFCTSDGTRLGLEMAQQPEAWFFDEGIGVMWENAKCYFVDKQGKRLDFGLWDDASVFRNGLVAVKKDGLWGFIDASGKQVIDCKYDEVGDFFVASGKQEAKAPLLAAVCKSGKWGYINEKAHLVIPLVGDRQGNWQGSAIYLWSNNREIPSSYWDADGNKMTSSDYYKRRNQNEQNDRGNSIAGKWAISENSRGLKGLVDSSGKIALKQEWRAIEWVGPRVVAVRGEHTAGLFSPEDGWLFRDDDQRRIQRQSWGDGYGSRLEIRLHKEGFIRIEETPRWGYARWKNLTPVDGLLVHYALDGNTQDSSGMENHSIYQQTQWTEDKYGNPRSAIQLDGTEEFVSCPLRLESTTPPQVTLVAWARSDTQGAWRHVIGVCHGRSIEIAAGWGARGVSGRWGMFGHRKLNVGEWVFLAATYDEGTQNATFRVNDELFESKMNKYSRAGSFRLGGKGGAKEFKGAIDEVRVYNRLLSKDELDGLYQQFLKGN